jgi:hypothetical protein
VRLTISVLVGVGDLRLAQGIERILIVAQPFPTADGHSPRSCPVSKQNPHLPQPQAPAWAGYC